jgi:hypothetical protein
MKERKNMQHWWNDPDGKTRVLREKSQYHFVHHKIPHGLL